MQNDSRAAAAGKFDTSLPVGFLRSARDIDSPCGPRISSARWTLQCVKSERLAEYGWKPHGDYPAQKAYHGSQFIVYAWNTGAYGFIEFEMSNSTISTVFRQPLKETGAYARACAGAPHAQAHVHVLVHERGHTRTPTSSSSSTSMPTSTSTSMFTSASTSTLHAHIHTLTMHTILSQYTHALKEAGHTHVSPDSNVPPKDLVNAVTVTCTQLNSPHPLPLSLSLPALCRLVSVADSATFGASLTCNGDEPHLLARRLILLRLCCCSGRLADCRLAAALPGRIDLASALTRQYFNVRGSPKAWDIWNQAQ